MANKYACSLICVGWTDINNISHKLFPEHNLTRFIAVCINLTNALSCDQVELAHGGRGPPPAVDRYSIYSGAGGRGGGGSGGDGGGRAGGVSRRSEYRG